MVPAGNKAKTPFVGQPYHKNNSSLSASGEGGILDKMAKNCMKIAKRAFLGQNSVCVCVCLSGGWPCGDKSTSG